jgi:hypothetical protein
MTKEKQSKMFTPAWRDAWDELLLKSLAIRCFLSIEKYATYMNAELLFLERLSSTSGMETFAYRVRIQRHLGMSTNLPRTEIYAVYSSAEELLQGQLDIYMSDWRPSITEMLLAPSPFVGIIAHAQADQKWSATSASPELLPFYGMMYEGLAAKFHENKVGSEGSQWALMLHRFGAFLYHQEQTTIRNLLGEPLF